MKHVGSTFALALALSPLCAHSANKGSLNVTAQVVGACKVYAAPIARLDSVPLQQGVSASTNLKFWCTKNTPYELSVDNGANFDTSAQTRRLKGSGNSSFIPYVLNQFKSNGVGAGEESPINVRIEGRSAKVVEGAHAQGDFTDIVQISINP